jgi:hypothetical protein
MVLSSVPGGLTSPPVNGKVPGSPKGRRPKAGSGGTLSEKESGHAPDSRASLNRYLEREQELLRLYPNGDHFIIMKDGEELGIFSDGEQALTAAHRAYGFRSFFIRQIEPLAPPVWA